MLWPIDDADSAFERLRSEFDRIDQLDVATDDAPVRTSLSGRGED